MLDFILRVLACATKYDNTDELWWRTDEEYSPVTFFVNCNDTFVWGCADCVTITPENIGVFEQSCEEADKACKHGRIYGPMLFCARVTKMRPMDCVYPPYKELWPLFDACGPHRPLGIGNPKPRPAPKVEP